MWQRIQTLYLGIATALIFSMFFCTFATIIGPDGSDVTIRYSEKLSYLTLMIMLITSHIAATASFKAFFLQARVSVIAGLLAIGFQIWLAIDFFINRNAMVFNVTALFPLAAAALDFMAAKRSMVDEMTIQSVKSARKARKKQSWKYSFHREWKLPTPKFPMSGGGHPLLLLRDAEAPLSLSGMTACCVSGQ